MAMLVLSFLSGVIGWTVETSGDSIGSINHSTFALIFLSGVIFIITIIASDRFTTRFEEDTQPWHKPSLSISPFAKRKPLQFWFFSSLCILSMGLGLLIRLLVLGEELPSSGIFLFIAAPSGILLGCGLALLIFKKSFISSKLDNKRQQTNL